VGVLRAVHGFKVGDLEAGRAAALQVLELAEESSFPQTVAQLILGVSLYWTGELDEAAGVLEEAARSARAGDNDLGHSYALGYLGLLEAERGRPAEAERLGRTAITLSDSPGFTEHFVLMVGHLALGRAAELNGSLNQAEAAIRRAVELGRRGAGRVEISAALLALAQVRHLQRDPDEARAALHEARAVLDGRQQGGRLASELRATERGLRQGAPGVALESPAPAEALTDRELAVLRLLSSDLSRRGIADALFVSTNTVKTHVKGIYRKLDASTRKEAVARARELGLL
jgi:LuxR family maltose regulon positive regulatory protein